MERLEAKKVNGQTYYYYSVWSWVNGRCRRTFQKYLGKPGNIYKAMHEGPVATHAEVFNYGLPIALWRELRRQRVVEIVDALCPKRNQGLTIGDYLGIAAVNRACDPTSKNGMWEWFQHTSLYRVVSNASGETLTSQRFWDHMDAVPVEKAREAWQRIIAECLKRESISLEDVCYDGTNFYTFIDTFNSAPSIARRGKNKQGRSNLRQVSYALFCTAADQIPLCFDVYPGNRNDCPEFSLMISRFRQFLIDIGWRIDSETSVPVTLIFDKGNNSLANMEQMDREQLHFVASVKLGEHKELAAIPNDDSRFRECGSPQLRGILVMRMEKVVYGKRRTVVLCHNPRLHQQQLTTLHADIAKALEGLSRIRDKLQDRAAGLVKGGKSPTADSVKKQVTALLRRPFLDQIIRTRISENPPLALHFTVDTKALERIANTYLGKKLIITTRSEWDEERILKAYHSQYSIEHVFRNMKDRNRGVWWPLHHWTNQKIHIHAFYCTVATLLRALLFRRVRQSSLTISYHRLFSELTDIKEVICPLGKTARKRKGPVLTVLSKRNDIQQQLLKTLRIPLKPQDVRVI
jgi:transposase